MVFAYFCIKRLQLNKTPGKDVSKQSKLLTTNTLSTTNTNCLQNMTNNNLK